MDDDIEASWILYRLSWVLGVGSDGWLTLIRAHLYLMRRCDVEQWKKFCDEKLAALDKR